MIDKQKLNSDSAMLLNRNKYNEFFGKKIQVVGFGKRVWEVTQIISFCGATVNDFTDEPDFVIFANGHSEAFQKTKPQFISEAALQKYLALRKLHEHGALRMFLSEADVLAGLQAPTIKQPPRQAIQQSLF